MKRPVITLAIIAGALLLFNAAHFPEPSTYVVGDKAEDFSLRNVDGRMVSLADYPDAKGFIIVFTCNHCPYAQLYEQRIIDLHRRYNAKGFPVIAINPNDPSIVPDDSFAEMKRVAQQNNYPFVYLFDSTQTVFPKFGASRTPHVFILDKNLVVRYIGAIDDNHEEPESVKEKYLENAIESLRAGKDVATAETKAIGCTIKWRKSGDAKPNMAKPDSGVKQ